MSDEPASADDASTDEVAEEGDGDEEPEVEGFMKFDPLGGMGTIMPTVKPPKTGTGPVSPGSTTTGDKPGSGTPSTINFPGPA